jgi:hypothetical protein
MSDAEWEVCEPPLPAPAWLAGKGGRPSRYCMRERLPAHHETCIYWSMIIVMTRRLARHSKAASTSAPVESDAA